MMKIPYNRLHALGDVVFAARGGKIHSFSLLDGKHISTWRHPDAEIVANAIKETSGAWQEAPAAAQAGAQSKPSEPPAKRQKLEDDKRGAPAPSAADASATQEKDDAQNDGEGKGKGRGKKKKKGRSEDQGHQLARAPDRPVITQVTSSVDGRHVLAVSGHDKVIWVFEHDGRGRLALLSQRAMPKRPSAITIAPDSQIICADKFGDVYSLPLVPTPLSPSSAARSSTPKPSASKPAAPAASTLTVHSKRNLEALANQRKHLELARRRGDENAKAEGPDFELTLLLGHVSMLTSLVLAESEGRRYILTGDRDEHIRVSRYIPQAHVIEGFCLGHKEFVSEIAVPAAREDVLVSGGGDDELFMWDWKAGKILSKTSILSLAQQLAPETTKVAVCGLFSLVYPCESGELTYVLAICEDVNAILSWQLTADNTLSHPSVMELPANPLHLSVSGPAPGTAPPKLIVAMDPGQTGARSLHATALAISDGRLTFDADSSLQDEALEASEVDASESEVRRLLYTIENLRKQTGGGEDGAEGAEAEETLAAEEQQGL